MNEYNIGIIGGGPAGYTYALHASAQGKSVVLFEKDKIGGVCLNKGCIPTKSILHSSELYKQALNAGKFGIEAENVVFDYAKVIEYKNKTVETLRKGLELALKNAKITVVHGTAEIINSKTIECNGEIFSLKNIICAAGSCPKIIKGLEFDHEFILSSDDVLNLENLPQSIMIVGSGAIGIEWARIFNNFGVKTTVVELADHLLPIADIDISKRLERIFKTEKIKYYTNTSVKEIINKEIYLSNGEKLSPEKVLVAVGRSPNEFDKIEDVTYLGDIKGEIQLAHYAVKEAIESTDGIKFDKNLVPSVVYGTPEIAWVGKKEQELEENSFKKSLVLMSSVGKAHCDGQTEGIIKILSQNNKIVGAHIISNEASSLIGQITIAIQNNITIDKLKEICFPHPTYSEGIFDAIFKFN